MTHNSPNSYCARVNFRDSDNIKAVVYALIDNIANGGNPSQRKDPKSFA